MKKLNRELLSLSEIVNRKFSFRDTSNDWKSKGLEIDYYFDSNYKGSNTIKDEFEKLYKFEKEIYIKNSLMNLHFLGVDINNSIKSEFVKNHDSLSKLVLTDKHKIYLKDYANKEIKMSALPKTLFILYLNHPDGISYNDLDKHRVEIEKIYSKITNYSEVEIIQDNINRVLDLSDNSIHVNISRIKSAFTKVIDDSIAKYYYVSGERNEAKKILLNRGLVVSETELCKVAKI